jgi:hypothetical protein
MDERNPESECNKPIAKGEKEVHRKNTTSAVKMIRRQRSRMFNIQGSKFNAPAGKQDKTTRRKKN